jgi:hypothetical protein
VAALEPIKPLRPFLTREDFIRDILPHQADSDLLRDLRELMPDTTDDISWP